MRIHETRWLRNVIIFLIFPVFFACHSTKSNSDGFDLNETADLSGDEYTTAPEVREWTFDDMSMQSDVPLGALSAHRCGRWALTMDFDIDFMRRSGAWGQLWQGVDYIWLSPAGAFQEPTKHWFQVSDPYTTSLNDGGDIYQAWDTGEIGFGVVRERIAISVRRFEDTTHGEYPLPEKFAKYSREYTANISTDPFTTPDGVTSPATYLRLDVRSPNGTEGYINLSLGVPDKGLPEEGLCYTATTGRGELRLY